MPLEILVTNDDGYGSKGIRVLSRILSDFGHVTVLAPAAPQSGKSSALTLDQPLRLHSYPEEKTPGGHSIRYCSLTGTPADCVKMAMNQYFSLEQKPDLLVSGINHGSNASSAVVYSGTLGAAAEGTLYGIPSIGVSLDCHSEEADFSPVIRYLPDILKHYLSTPPRPGIYLNINFPDRPLSEIRGIRLAAQGNGMWTKEFCTRTDPHGHEYFWMTGEFLDTEDREIGDHKLLEEGYITIVPHRIDTTDYQEMERLAKSWNL